MNKLNGKGSVTFSISNLWTKKLAKNKNIYESFLSGAVLVKA